MSYSIFEPAQLIKQSLLQRLFKQQPTENAIIEVNNLLASKPLQEISNSDISHIENLYGVDIAKEFSLNIQEFYAVYLNYCLMEEGLSENEKDDLKHLSSILRIDHSVIQMLHQKIGIPVYRRAWEKATKNGILSDAEEKRLKALSEALQLPEKEIKNISYDVCSKYIKDYVKRIIDKLYYSIDDEKKLIKIAEDLKVRLNLDSKTKNILNKLRQYSKYEESELQEISTKYQLQKNEVCYYTIPNVTWYEYRQTIAYPSSLNYSNIIKKTKRVHIDQLLQSAKSKMSDLKYIDSGTLYLTNKRVLLDGELKSSNIRLEKIVDLTPFDNGFRVNKNTAKPVFLNFYNSDIAVIILCKILVAHTD